MGRVEADEVLDGLSVGDAVGEMAFSAPDRFARKIEQMESLQGGIWWYTDDTEMALGIRDVLNMLGRIDPDVLARAFAERYQADPDKGYGGGAHRILQGIAAGQPWQELASNVFGGGSMGNGGAMRVAALGAWFAEDLDRVAEEARLSAQPTHQHPEGIAGAIAIAVAAAVAVRGRGRPAAELRAVLFDAVLAYTPEGDTRGGMAAAQALDADAPLERAVNELGNGSRITAPDTVPYVLWQAARGLEDYRAAIISTAEGGGDCDTTCAMVGGIVAGYLGNAAIPALWLERREKLR